MVWRNRPNTNMNIIRLEKITRIRILVFGLNYSNTELFAHLCQSWDSSWHHSWGPSYECYSVWWKKRPNTNTNIIWFEKIDQIRIWILFGLKISTEYEYEYYSAWKNHPNTNTKTSIRPQLFKQYLNTELFAHLCFSHFVHPYKLPNFYPHYQPTPSPTHVTPDNHRGHVASHTHYNPRQIDIL